MGDRNVLAELLRRGWALGGEQSGHIIDTGFVPAGDGIAAALLTLEALGDGDLAERHAMEKLPQRLVNVRVRDRDGARRRRRRSGRRSSASRAALEGRGRVLVRPSGTEPLVRVMVEAPERGRVPGRSSSRSGRRSSESELRLTRSSMCGIVGYVGRAPCRELLLAGLEKLEYRGYDSAGLSLLDERRDRLGARGRQPLAPARGRGRRDDRRRGHCRRGSPPASATRAGPPTAA